MPKITLNQFKGLGNSDKNLSNGLFYSGQDIDLYRDPEYLVPGFLKTDITITGQNQDIIDIVYDPVGSYSYLFGNNGRIYCVASNDAIAGSFGGVSQNYAVITGLTEGKGIVLYSTQDSAWRIYFFYNGSSYDIAKCAVNTADWSGANLDADWGSSTEGALSAGIRDVIEFNSYAWFTNGHYIGKLDTVAATSTINLTAFNLGDNWAANRLFKTDNYIGIFASEGSNLAGSVYPSASRATGKCRLYLWDGVSDQAYKIVDLKGIVQVHSVVNNNGNVFVFVDGGSAGHYWTVLQSNGSEYYLEKIRQLKHDISGTQTTLLSPNSNSTIETYKGNILFGTYNRGLIMCVGRDSLGESFQLSCPMSASIATNSRVTAIKQTSTDKLYVGYYDGTNYKFAKFTTGYATATYKAGYTDLGQKGIVKYVKFYFKPLVSGDSITVGLDTDYGTSTSLGTISYATDGAITSKRFEIKKQCHAFRPTINWTTGGTAISKIIVDYEFVGDL